MLRWLVCALVVGWLYGTVEAGCPTTITTTGYYTTPVVGNTYATTTHAYVPYNTAVAAYVPLAIAVPTYSTGYLPQNPPAATAPSMPAKPVAKEKDRSEELMREMLMEMRRINTRIDAVERNVSNIVPVTNYAPQQGYQQPQGYGGQGFNNGYQPQANRPKGGSQALNAACAACHERGKESNGGGYVLTEADGSVVRPTERQMEKIHKHLVKGTMPPPDNEMGIPPLTEQGKALVAEAVKGR